MRSKENLKSAILIMSGTLKTAPFKVRSFPSTRNLLWIFANFCAGIFTFTKIARIQKTSAKQPAAFKPWWRIVFLMLIVVAFIAVSYIAQQNLGFFKNYIQDDFLSMVIYILILIVSAVFAPIDVVFLMPLATAAWGWFTAALLSLLGWTIGSAVVFVLARKYGVYLIKRFIPLKKIYKYEQFIPKGNMFLGIIFLRIAIPFDAISYVIGLFTKMKFMPYFFATLIGFLPLAFFLALIGTLPAPMQIIGFFLFLLAVIIGFLSAKCKYTKK